MVTGSERSGERLDAFEPWSPSAFFAGGFLLVLGFLALAILRLQRFSLVYVGGGFLFVVALIGCYSRCTLAPPLALGVGAATGVAALAFAVAAVRIGLAVAGMPGAIPLPDGMPPVLVVAYAALGAGLVLAGVGGFQSGDTTRSVGLLLTGAGLSFPSVFLMESLVWNLPGWVLVTAHMAFGVALIVAGVLLDAERVVADGWVPPDSRATSEATASGWTSEHVRDEYDVDGFESRGRTRMATRLQVQRIQYELAGSVSGSLVRSLYPLRRALGRLLNREAAVEQAIAEDEYILTSISATDREGMGSPYWRLGMASLVGLVLGGLGFMLAGIAAGGIVMGRDVGPEVWGFAGVAGVWVAGGLATLASVRMTLRQLADEA